ncbi:hypothetical protein [Nocardiopsis listeri]|uniref:hypothetical protein n=1 Tax=Nocardiopsis listeri TaxID=53440 RepID=UPI000AAAD3C3|nr:hypothetical protein [Nocardiopsis listeri]
MVLAIGEGTLNVDDLVGPAPLVRGELTRRADRPNVFKGSGMSCRDLAVALGVAPTDRPASGHAEGLAAMLFGIEAGPSVFCHVPRAGFESAWCQGVPPSPNI